MCRIDAGFGKYDLDEKAAPSERFIQALDEYEIAGQLRSLLTNHFATTWQYVFSSANRLEEALDLARSQATTEDQAAAVISSGPLAGRLREQLCALIHKYVTGRTLETLEFAKDVAQTFFPHSPYKLFKKLKPCSQYGWFITALYGNEYFLHSAVFDDPALIAEGERERVQVLWSCLPAWSHDEQQIPTELGSIFSPDTKALLSVASTQRHAGPPTPAAHQWLQRVRFLEAWVKSDAAAGRLHNPDKGVFHNLDTELESLRSDLKALRSGDSDVKALCESATNWLNNLERQLKETLAIHMDLTNADEEQLADWAKQLDNCVSGRITQLPSGEEDVAEQQHLRRLLSMLSSDKAEAWAKQSASHVIATLQSGQNSSLKSSRKWWASDYSARWKAKLEAEIHALGVKDALAVLSCWLWLPNEAAYRWWNSLLEKLIHDSEFPLALTPQWTVAAIDRLDDEVVLPYIDKSLGLLRGRLSNAAEPDLNNQLVALLSRLSHLDPRKALRHRLMLMRSSYVPFADKSLSRFSSLYSDKAVSWYSPLSEQARNLCAKKLNGTPYVDRQECEAAEQAIYQSFALDLIDFCLSRLRLRKGEKKPEDERYADGQVTEQSAIWRQGYLKALLEIGLDPNGKAHKTVFFTRQFDPDESVRDVAKEAYRAVRRETKSKKSVQDFKRGLIAAEWWLLMSQRRALDLPIDPEGALKTRRNMMRNP
ncbi:hypothetical protein SAMN05216214_108115 [Atopomonas hussainii]|uniref:Uncharacterized protein n=1 Tax=Atopomonas hussainii TaxID=1429083 RepID=A0A1H7MLI2_9GAMM|nr:hypothetical protein [Atopomonas hussainii]SEL12072.1 hypothetical protein SAMN05216214_108115 [Atopomonas hussainii]